MTNIVRLDYRIIADIIQEGSRVLDLGCGSGELIEYLEKEKKAKVQGIEVDEKAIHDCIEKGLNVFHSDIDSGLPDFPDKAFDYIILNQSLQQIKKIDFVMEEAFRVAKNVIIGFPNFAHYKARYMLSIQGRSPVTKSLPYQWHDTPNVRFLSAADFKRFCKEKNFNILEAHFLGKNREIHFLPNLFAYDAIFVLSK
ncbi:MAG: methionine biosynthesis protein MetW [Elusimicrobia bacterium]|nr:methionine biosynthesis protein MetW [Candidatus Liberimonas magnetica]